MPQFQIELLDNTKQIWDLADYCNVGSDSTCRIQLTLPDVEARHARLEVTEKQLLIKDLRSTGGTYVNGAQVLEAILKDGDLVSIGSVDFVIHDNSKIQKEFPLASKCEYWDQQLKSLSSVAATKFPVLLLGPSGAGKDIVAQTLHEASPFSKAPFISVNCSALTETLVESELFGHIKGSFTGAVADRKGAFESARGGTLFLDEIGDLPYGLQAKLLRALENNEIRPVGADHAVKTNVRIVAATHQNLYQKIREGSFRSDLFFRLNVITIEAPALKERLEDFDELLYTIGPETYVS
jgi:DNA-binding NtrC family response regulator